MGDLGAVVVLVLAIVVFGCLGVIGGLVALLTNSLVSAGAFGFALVLGLFSWVFRD